MLRNWIIYSNPICLSSLVSLDSCRRGGKLTESQFSICLRFEFFFTCTWHPKKFLNVATMGSVLVIICYSFMFHLSHYMIHMRLVSPSPSVSSPLVISSHANDLAFPTDKQQPLYREHIVLMNMETFYLFSSPPPASFSCSHSHNDETASTQFPHDVKRRWMEYWFREPYGNSVSSHPACEASKFMEKVD